MTVVDPLLFEARRTIARGSQSFAAAARLFDPQTRARAMLLYAWCRACDDAVDGQSLGSLLRHPVDDPAARLAFIETETRAALAGARVSHPAFAGLARIAAETGLPPVFPEQHLAGFRSDVEGRVYRGLDDLLGYAYAVAGAVGVMMSWIMGPRDAATLDRAADLGIAFQLTNIARDIVPDAEAGRIYLPRHWLAEEGVPERRIADPAYRPALARLARRLVTAAEPYYASAGEGLAALPFRSAWAVAAARGVYRRIGTEVVRLGPAAWDGRVATSPAAKAALCAAALAGAVSSRASREPAPRDPALWRRPGR